METKGGGTKTLSPGPQENDSENEFQFLMACGRSGQQRAQTLRVQGRGRKDNFPPALWRSPGWSNDPGSPGQINRREKKPNLTHTYIRGFCEKRGLGTDWAGEAYTPPWAKEKGDGDLGVRGKAGE